MVGSGKEMRKDRAFGLIRDVPEDFTNSSVDVDAKWPLDGNNAAARHSNLDYRLAFELVRLRDHILANLGWNVTETDEAQTQVRW